MISLFGTVYRVHPLLVLVMIFSVLGGRFLELLVLFGIVLIHELGHAVAAYTVGWKVLEIQLLPFGGVAIVDEQGGIKASHEIFVALAGPLQNGLMILFAYLMQMLGAWDAEWCRFFIQANATIALFNLLPILPLDGGKALQALLSMAIPYHQTLRFFTWTSLACSTITIAWAIGASRGGLNLNIFMLAVFLLFSNYYTWRNLPILFIRFLMGREFRTKALVRKGCSALPIVVAPHLPISRIVRLFRKGKYHLIYIMDDGGKIKAVLPEQRLIHCCFMENRPGCAVGELLV